MQPLDTHNIQHGHLRTNHVANGDHGEVHRVRRTVRPGTARPGGAKATADDVGTDHMKAIGIDPIYDIPARNNPLPWTNHWLNSKGQQNAPQETEIESYVVGAIKQDIKKDTFSGFKL